MTMEIRDAGLLTTIQDLGRKGFQKYGVSVSGAVDMLAARVINMLVGNDEKEAVLEMTLKGATITFEEDALLAIGGGDMAVTIDNAPVKSCRPISIKAGSELAFGSVKKGCRVYLAVAGGLDVPSVMNSRSTYLQAGIGGLEGRMLQKGDVLKRKTLSYRNRAIWNIVHRQNEQGIFSDMDSGMDAKWLPELSNRPAVRTFKGRQYEWFTEKSRAAFFSETFSMTPKSDRMGCRLNGPTLEKKEERELISEAVTNGTIQVTSDGNPIMLLSDRQTTGGYAKIGQVATVDLPILAQLRPGDELTFKEISHEEAQELLIDREKGLQKMKQKMNHHVENGI